jgi:tight adherence protein B
VTANEFRRMAAALDAGISLGSVVPESGLLRDILELARETGAPRSRLIRIVADTLDDNDALRRETDIAATSVRHSAVVLVALPIVTAVGSALFGVDSLLFLVTEPAGWVCLVLGTGATVAGWHWMSVLRRRVVTPAVETGILSDCVAEVLSVSGMTSDSQELVAGLAVRWDAAEEWKAIHTIRESSRDSGVPVAGLLRHHSQDLRRAARFRVRAQIEELPGRLLIPLGVCLFPAFITLTVIPAIAGMAADFFERG